ncbi:MAG TPA: hypothetical protein V6D08_19090 [Candidatus Obscuribacterales bacterium]
MQKLSKVQIAAALVAALGVAAHGKALASQTGGNSDLGVKEKQSPAGIAKTVKLADKNVSTEKGTETSCKGAEGSCKGKEGSCKGKEGSCKGKEGSCKGKEGSCKGKEGSCKSTE